MQLYISIVCTRVLNKSSATSEQIEDEVEGVEHRKEVNKDVVITRDVSKVIVTICFFSHSGPLTTKIKYTALPSEVLYFST